MSGHSTQVASAPLIQHDELQQAPTARPPSASNAQSAPVQSTTDSRSNGGTTWTLVLIAGLSGLLFGYDTGVISSTLLHLPYSFPDMTTATKSAITAAPSLLALLASPLASVGADTLGRRPTICIAALLFVLGAALQAVAPSTAVMVGGRAVVGVAIGGASCVVPLYIAEISSAERRGRLVTVQSLFVTGGQVVAYLIGWACGDRWRVAVGLGVVPAVVQLVLIGWVVESPRFLVMKGRREEARDVLESLDGVESVDEVLARISRAVREEDDTDGWKGRWKELVRVPGNRRALTIACMLQGLQQLCGFNVLMYFSATIFALVGYSNPVTTSLYVAGTNFFFTIAAFSLIDSVGRRRILLVSIPFMVLGLVLCSVCFQYIPRSGTSLLSVSVPPTTSLPHALLVSLILYVAAYALGLGCVPWQQSELFPLSVRSLGSGLATATNWTGNFIIGVTFLPMMDMLGSTITFAMYAAVCFIGVCLVYFFYPETAGLELEDVAALLADGWGTGRGRDRAKVPLSDEADDPDDH